MFKKFVHILFQLLAVFITILCLINAPFLFINMKEKSISFEPFQFIHHVGGTLKELSSLHSLSFEQVSLSGTRTIPLFPTVFEPYTYSFAILFAAFFLALFIATVISYIYFLSSKQLKDKIDKLVFLLEAVPDVMIMIGLQVFFMWVLRTTGNKPIEIMTFSDNRAYLLPIFCLAILPTLQMFRMMILYIKEEEVKLYVEVAYGKGLSAGYIMRIHLFKNIVIHLFHHSKTIFVFLLSNLFVLEYVFHMHGIIKFLIQVQYFPTVTFIVLIMILLPFYVLSQIISSSMKKWQAQMKGEVA
ncbi:ABC transporter permease subunit [Bacillus rhizoplanae]|uniref:ABC transporter permease subunit n=1 Tax=Bacillus rhizoplanae TaxID=2880966 RepID=UPI003D1A8C5D